MKTIYCIGDSFTQGTELADAEYFGAKYPGYMTMSAEDSLKRESYRQWWFKNTSELNLSKKLIGQEKNKAWPAKIGNMLNCNSINAGTAGRSMRYIANTLIQDLIKFDVKPDLVIVQYTDPSRIECNSFDDSVTIFLSNHCNFHLHEKIRSALLELETDNSLYYSWLTELIRIQDFCNANNINILFTDSINVKNSYLSNIRNSKVQDLEKYLDDSVLSMLDIARDFKLNEFVFCAGGHFTEIVHDKFAEELSKIIKDRNLI